MPTQTVHTYAVLDLVRERAAANDWELIFDNGNVVVYEKPGRYGGMFELEVRFNREGRIEWAEKRKDGEWTSRMHEMDNFGTTDVQIETLRLF
ncbi:hypothetical protein SEA_ARCHIE_133 [Mycobacterium phage Archie]|uniref:Uncharacterized protein n=1 Tax=Mycobacterium phage Archie TaxID=1718599 RepID=A0A0M4S3S8_9CAUD|nr:hypothetical protein AVU85_gp110 [Mycobacterium phage Archie]ALF00427.1 hypothetical protein SEA_ARCHIE_133 [Mycobacterium phage Archie]